MLTAIGPNTNNKPTFKSVIPVRVYIDELETFDPKVIRSACRQLTSTLIGPAKGDTHKLNIINSFAKHDPDYIYEYGYHGYPKNKKGKKVQPSDLFRCIVDRDGTYLFTGYQAQKLKEIGEDLGKETQVCKARKIANSFDLQVAKRNYGNCIANFIRSKKMRITEFFDKETKIKYGAPVSLKINMKSNGKYGLSTFKMKLANINIEPQ